MNDDQIHELKANDPLTVEEVIAWLSSFPSKAIVSVYSGAGGDCILVDCEEVSR